MNRIDYTITPEEIMAMLNHWLNCPPNGYLGSTYGADYTPLLQAPMLGGQTAKFIAKMRQDLPIIDIANGDIELGIERIPPDKQRLVIRIGSLGYVHSKEVAYAN